MRGVRHNMSWTVLGRRIMRLDELHHTIQNVARGALRRGMGWRAYRVIEEDKYGGRKPYGQWLWIPKAALIGHVSIAPPGSGGFIGHGERPVPFTVRWEHAHPLARNVKEVWHAYNWGHSRRGKLQRYDGDIHLAPTYEHWLEAREIARRERRAIPSWDVWSKEMSSAFHEPWVRGGQEAFARKWGRTRMNARLRVRRNPEFTDSQLAAQADIKIGRLTTSQWNEHNVRAILANYSDTVVRKIMVEHMKFAGIFTAGRQLADWCWKELKAREGGTQAKMNARRHTRRNPGWPKHPYLQYGSLVRATQTIKWRDIRVPKGTPGKVLRMLDGGEGVHVDFGKYGKLQCLAYEVRPVGGAAAKNPRITIQYYRDTKGVIRHWGTGVKGSLPDRHVLLVDYRHHGIFDTWKSGGERHWEVVKHLDNPRRKRRR